MTKTKPSSQTIVRTGSLPFIHKTEPEPSRTRTVSLDGDDINVDDVFSQWNDQSSNGMTTVEKPATTEESKSMWKQIFSKPMKSKLANDDDLKEQWAEIDKDHPSTNHRFQSTVQRTCPFYKKIPGKIDLCVTLEHILSLRRYIVFYGCI